MIRETAKGYLATKGGQCSFVLVVVIRETAKGYLATKGGQCSLVLVVVIRETAKGYLASQGSQFSPHSPWPPPLTGTLLCITNVYAPSPRSLRRSQTHLTAD